MSREDISPKIFDALFDAVKSIVTEEYKRSSDVQLDFILLPNSIFKVKRNGIILTVKLSPDRKSFDVEHSRLASRQADSETETRKLVSIVEGDDAVRLGYEDGEPMSVEETARSLMQSLFVRVYDRIYTNI